MRNIFLVIIILLVAISCNREKSTWDIDFIGPIAFAEYQFSDIISDTLLIENDENFLSLSFSQELIQLKADSLIAIEDTIISNGYTLPPIISGFPLSPGLAFPFLPGALTLNPGNNIEIKQATICTGNIDIVMINPLPTELVVTYVLPELTLDGISFLLTDTLLPAVGNIPSEKTTEFDISNYEMDLTLGGTTVNELDQALSFINSTEGDSVFVTQLDTLKFNFSINELTLEYAKGFFGNTVINESESFELDGLLGLEQNAFLLNEASMALKISNGIGVDFRISNTNYTATNSATLLLLNLENDDLNQSLNINRAIDLGSEPQYSEKEIFLDENNSNILDIIALAPDGFEIDFNLEINPLGNSSSSNDFIYKNDGIKIDAEVDIPLSFSVENLEIQDTLEFQFEQNENAVIEEAVLTLFSENQMPFDIELDLYILNKAGTETSIVTENQIIPSCEYLDDVCGVTKSELSFELSPKNLETLRDDGLLFLTGKFSSQGQIKITSDQKIKLKAVIDAKILTGL